eukprot:1331002-Amphidinium_carterae.1
MVSELSGRAGKENLNPTGIHAAYDTEVLAARPGPGGPGPDFPTRDNAAAHVCEPPYAHVGDTRRGMTCPEKLQNTLIWRRWSSFRQSRWVAGDLQIVD